MSEGAPEGRRIRCRRVDRAISVEEHRRCPYCFGKEAAIESGEHETFCDFEPGKDPVSFGFPETHGRHLHG